MLVSDREVLLARVLLHILDRVSKDDRDQEWLEFYNAIKPMAEGILRA